MKISKVLFIVSTALLVLFSNALVTTASHPKTLTLAIGGERADGYDPVMGWGRYGNPLFQSTLLKRDENLKVVNDLAVNCKLSEDKLTWRIEIRDDVRFSDGAKLTAEDVVFTFKKASVSGGKNDLSALEEAVKTGKYSLELRLKYPMITFINKMITLGIVPKHRYDEKYARNPVGSGPYKMVGWSEGQHLAVDENPYYYGEKPIIKKIVFLFTDEDTSFAAAKAGKVDVVCVPQSLAVQKIWGMSLHPVPSVDNRGIMFPCVPDEGFKTADGNPVGNNVTADIAIRKAINYSIDRETLVKGILEGYGSKAFGVVDGLPWDEESSRINDGDLKKAVRILEEGGWKLNGKSRWREKNGLKAEFTLLYPASDSIRQSLALASADMVKKAGIKINVIGKSWDEIRRHKHSNAVLFGWGSHDPTEVYNLYHSSKSGEGYFNSGFYENDLVDKYLELAMGANTFDESIRFWRAAQWDGNTGFTTKGDASWAWLVNLTHTYFVNNKLDIGKSQIEPHGHGWPVTANIHKWRWK